MAGEVCKLATVVAKPGCSVHVCNHGILHVTIGAVTLRLSEDSLGPLVAVLNEAVAQMRRADDATRESHLH